MKKFFKEITERDGQSSSKKLWYNVACCTSTLIVLWFAYKDNMEDWAYICMLLAYMCTVGGFEVILEFVKLMIAFKNGGSNANNTMVDAKLEVSSTSSRCDCPDCPALVVPDTQPKGDKGTGSGKGGAGKNAGSKEQAD